MNKSRVSQAFLALLAVLLVLNIAGCGRSGSSDAPEASSEEQAAGAGTQEEEGVEEGIATGPQVLVYEGASESETNAAKALAKGDLACSVVTGVSEADLAEALTSGSEAIVVAPLDMAARFFNSYECPCMAIDATANDTVPITSVVSLAFFGQDPETIVSYVAHHGESAASAGLTFYNGTAMNDYLSDALNSLYVMDPSVIGGQLLPDNFFFLG